MYTILTAQVTDQTLQLTNEPKLASGGVNEIRVEVTFCPLWDGMAKTAVFYRKPEEVYHVLLQNGTGMVPQEVAATEGPVFFGVFGVSGDTVRTSEVRTLVFEQGALTTGTNAPEPTPDVYQQILAAIAAHAENTNNPHGVTIAQIGAAPAGHGLGELQGEQPILADAHNIFKTGWYRVHPSVTANAPVSGVLRVEADNYRHVTLTLYTNEYLPNDTTILRQCLVDGVWQDWEFVNPPMRPGVEYRTTERHNSRVVYTMLIDGGLSVSGQNEFIVHSIAGATIFHRQTTVGQMSGDYIANNDINNSWSVRTSHEGVHIRTWCGADRTGLSIQHLIKYYK